MPSESKIVTSSDTNDTFEIGAIVALRSGGPGLTVLGQVGDRVHCVFFSDELGEFKETLLPAVALARAEMEDGDEDEEEEDENGDEDEEEEDEDQPGSRYKVG